MATKRHLLAALALGLGLGPRSAAASGFDVPAVGSVQSGPLQRDAAAIHHNPANLVHLGRGEFMGGAGVVFGRATYQRVRRSAYQREDSLEFKEPVEPEFQDPSKTGPAASVSAAPFSAAGDLFGVARLPRAPVALGLGIYTPYAAILDFPDDGPQRFALRDVTLITSHITAALGVEVHEKVAIGGGISYVLGFLELSKIQDFAAVDDFGNALAQPPSGQDNDFGIDAPVSVRELAVLARPAYVTRAFSHSMSFNAAVTVQAHDKVDLALIYQHGSRMRYRGDFTLDMNDPFWTQDLAANGIQYEPRVTGDATISFWIPIRATVAARIRATSRVAVDLVAQYVAYSLVKDMKIVFDSPGLAQPELGIGNITRTKLPREWNDVIQASVTTRVAAGDRIDLSVLAGYHSPVSPPETVDVGSVDGHRLLGGVGLAAHVHPRVDLVVSTHMQGILPRTVTTSRHDLGNGEYGLWIAFGAAHLRVFFGGPHETPSVRGKSAG